MSDLKRREYTDAERTVRGLNAWRDDPEMHIADLNTRIRLLEESVTSLQLMVLKLERAAT